MVFIGIGVILFLFVPVPVTTYTEGVIWTEGEAQVTAAASGFVKKVYVPTNTKVDINQTLMVLEDASLMTAYQTAKYRLDELQAEYIAQEYENRTKAAMIKDDLDAAHESYRALSKKVKNLTIRSKSQGIFTASNFDELTGYYVHQGDTLGYIINADKMIVKAAVPQARIGLLETYDTKIEFSVASDLKKRYSSKIIRKTPQATTYLTSAVLGTSGGGVFPVDKRDKNGKKLLAPVFQIDLEIPKDVHLNKIGGRVYVRLDHGELPLAKQLALSFNQLFLRHFYAK
jgi:putative peptide zinc metalloprotease protein